MQEIWKDCAFGYPGYYMVSNLGRIKSMPRKVKRGDGIEYMPEKILKTRTDANGYEFIGLYVAPKKQIFKKIHNLLAVAFLDNPENKKCVNHKNGVKSNNYVCNLEWCTHKENSIHAAKNNLLNPRKGENHPFTKLKNEDILIIRGLRKEKSCEEISKLYNVSRRAIGNIINYKTWAHV